MYFLGNKLWVLFLQTALNGTSLAVFPDGIFCGYIEAFEARDSTLT